MIFTRLIRYTRGTHTPAPARRLPLPPIPESPLQDELTLAPGQVSFGHRPWPKDR